MRCFHPSEQSPSNIFKKNRITSFLVLAFAAIVLATSASPLQAQFDSGETDPPPAPKPRFPQLPDDPVVPQPGDPKTSPANVDRSTELVGHIQKIEGRKITFKHNTTNKSHTVAVAPKATIVLNKKPANLEQLQETDFVRVTLSQTTPDPVADRVVAARVIADTPPQDPPPVRTRPRTTEDRRPRRLGNEAGLGVTFADSPNLGVLILDVHQDTPAWTAGIQVGDYLLQLGKKEIESGDDLLNELSRHEPNDTVPVVIWRRGKTKEGRVTLTTDEAARDREATDNRVLIVAETHGDDTVVVKRAPESVFLDREPEKSTVVLDREPDDRIVIDREPSSEKVVIPEDYDELSKDYRQLLERVSELEQELNRLKKQ